MLPFWWRFLCPNFIVKSNAIDRFKALHLNLIMVHSIALFRLDNKVFGATPYFIYLAQSTRAFHLKVELKQMKTTTAGLKQSTATSVAPEIKRLHAQNRESTISGLMDMPVM
jgi:hypothetical protein